MVEKYYCVGEGDYVTGRLESSVLKDNGRIILRCFTKGWNKKIGYYSVREASKGLINAGIIDTKIIEHISEPGIEITKILVGKAKEYMDFLGKREIALRSLFGNYFSSNESVDAEVGFQKSKGTEFCPTLSEEKQFIKKEFDKSWDLEGANRANMGFFSTLLYATRDAQDPKKTLLEAGIDLTLEKLAIFGTWYNKKKLKRVALEKRCGDFDSEKNVELRSKASLGKPSKKLIVLGGFVPSKIAEAVHYDLDLDFQFGLEPPEKRRLIDDAEKNGLKLKLNTQTTNVDRNELEELRRMLGVYNANPNWVIVKNNGKPLTRRKMITKNEKKDTIKDGIILVFKKGVKINKENKDVIALMGMGAGATVVSPNVVLTDPSAWLMNNEFEEKLTDVAGFGNEFQAVLEFEFDRKYTELGTPFEERDLKQISKCWVDSL